MIDEFRARPKEASASDLDAKVVAAVRADARELLSAMVSSVAEGCRAETGTVERRTASVLTCWGRVGFSYPYAPKAGVARAALGKLGCGAKGEVRATPEVRRIVAEASAQLDSFQDAKAFLNANAGIDASVSSMLTMTRRAAERTRKAWSDGALAENPSARPKAGMPEDARYVGPTFVVSVDGTCVGCTHADTAGIKGKDGGEAGSREIKVVALAVYTHVDRKGRPIVRRGDVWYFASDCTSDELESTMNTLARRRGICNVQRIQFIGDGAVWIQNIWEHAFKSLGAIRTLDFVHALGYLHTLLEAVSEDGALAADYKRFKGTLRTWGGKTLMKNLEKTFGTKLDKLGGDARKALDYLRERAWMMDYRTLRRQGYYIGSGIIESACKSVVAARCKLAGMHWRHANAAGISLLRATLRSNFKIVV